MTVDLGIDGRVALVMGASLGIGRAIAASLAREGARVAIASRSPERIEDAAEGLRAGAGGEVAAFTADAEDLDGLAALPGEVEERARDEIPAGRLGRPEEYGDLVAFICSDRSAYLNGYQITLDGGLLRSV